MSDVRLLWCACSVWRYGKAVGVMSARDVSWLCEMSRMRRLVQRARWEDSEVRSVQQDGRWEQEKGERSQCQCDGIAV